MAAQPRTLVRVTARSPVPKDLRRLRLALIPIAISMLMSAASASAAAEPLLYSSDVFVSGKDGYHTYRIPAIETAPDGTLLAFAEARKYGESDPGFGKQDIDLVYRDDHGQTWRRGQVVPGTQGGDECQVVELADGRILMDIRQESGPHRWRAESADGGETWAAPRVGTTVTAVACAIERFTLSAAGDDCSRLLWTGPMGTERRRLVIRTSYDEGKTFANERLVSDQFAAYPELTILKDRTVGVLWERGVERGYQLITFTRLNLAFLEPK